MKNKEKKSSSWRASLSNSPGSILSDKIFKSTLLNKPICNFNPLQWLERSGSPFLFFMDFTISLFVAALDKLNISTAFLDLDPENWPSSEDYLKGLEVVQNIKVTNDHAETWSGFGARVQQAGTSHMMKTSNTVPATSCIRTSASVS